MKIWVEEELQFVKKYFNNYPTKEIADELRRSVKEVTDKAKELGVIPSIPQGFKKCKDCNKVKKLKDFYRSNKSKDGFNIYCKACDNLRRRNNDIIKKIKEKKDSVLEKEKLSERLKRDTEKEYFTCTSCNQIKIGTDFYFNSKKLKRFRQCIVCYQKKQEERKLKKILERGY